MSESDTALHDEEVFSDELPDAVLEVAGSKCWEAPASSCNDTHQQSEDRDRPIILSRDRTIRYDWILLRARDLLHEANDPQLKLLLRDEARRRISPRQGFIWLVTS